MSRLNSIWMKMVSAFFSHTTLEGKHLNNIFAEGELDENRVVSIMEITTPRGVIAAQTVEHLTKLVPNSEITE